MPYVMVPVPEEHVLEVMQYLTKLAARTPAQAPAAWDAAAVERFFLEANPPTRALLSFLADPVRAGSEVRPKDVADALGMEPSDVAGIVGPLHRQFRKANRVPLVESRAVAATSRTGRPVKHKTLVMSMGIAEMVRAAEKAVPALERDVLVDVR